VETDLAMTIMPGFDRHPDEVPIIGRILVAFGEIEVTLAVVVGNVGLQDLEQGLRVIYKIRGASSRLEAADALLRHQFAQIGLEQDYLSNRAAITHCKTIRNQFAHCIWADDQNPGLYFTDLQDAADRADMLTFNWRHVDAQLLTKQLEYFDNALTGVIYLENQWMRWRGKTKIHDAPKPEALEKPPLHNPPSQHVPLWISEDEKQSHLELARETESVGQQPVRPPSVPKLTEQEWIAKYRKEKRPLPDGSTD
jgi:hypothetical protein